MEPMEECNLDEFDRNLTEVLSVLQNTTISLDECRAELKELILQIQDLERQLMNQKNKNTNDEQQNIILRDVIEALEEKRQKLNKELIKLKVPFELSVAERDSLKGQVYSQCIEIDNLKRQIDDLSSKHRNHTQKDITEQLQKIKISINQAANSIITLKKKQNELEDNSQINQIELLILSVKRLEKQKIAVEKEADEIKKELIIKTAELSKLQNMLKNCPSIAGTVDYKQEVLNNWKLACSDLEAQLNNEKAVTTELTEAIVLSHENEEYLRKKLIAIDLEKCCEFNDVGTQTETNNLIF